VNDHPAVIPWRGDIYSALGTANYILNEKTDLLLSYSYSRADFGQPETDGLRAVIDYDWHVLHAGIQRQFRKRIATRLQYAFHHFREPSSGGFADYRAHGVFGVVTAAWP
jgi:hypothetical protein